MQDKVQDGEIHLLLEDYGKHIPTPDRAGSPSKPARPLPAPLNSHFEIHLLLEEYGERPRRWLQNAASSPPTPGPVSSGSPADLRLLLEDFPARSRRWLAAFQPLPADLVGGRAERADAHEEIAAAGLHLLVEDFDPASRFLELRQVWGEDGTRAVRAEPPRVGSHARSPGEDEPTLELLPRLDEDLLLAQRRKSRAASLAFHAALVLLLIGQSMFLPSRLPDASDPGDLSTVTLLAPPEQVLLELTQPIPNKGEVTKRFQGMLEAPRPVIIAPPTPEPAAPVVVAPQPEPPEPVQPDPEPEPAPEPEPEPESAEPEEPEEPEPAQRKAQPEPAAAQSPQPGEFRRGTQVAKLRPNELPAPRRPSKAREKPKLTLETPKATAPGRPGPIQIGSLKLNARPDQMIEAAVEQLAKTGGGKQSVGDRFAGGGAGGYLPPSPGNTGSNLELLSDPKGVDFRPYLMRVLQSVRRNWFAVIPESARLGMSKGRVAIQFAVARDGSVPKLVIASTSRVPPLDRAAVAGISASVPFPRLPPDFSGREVRLQLVFRYNTSSR